MALPPVKKQIYYFCDESSQIVDDWLAVAGLAVPKDSIAKISRDLAVIKEATGKKGEVKWSNAKSYGGRPHRAFADYLFDLIKRNNAHFHIRFSPMKE